MGTGARTGTGLADLGALLCADPIFCSPFLDSTRGEGVALILILGTVKDRARGVLIF